jgi:hypothetical protein
MRLIKKEHAQNFCNSSEFYLQFTDPHQAYGNVIVWRFCRGFLKFSPIHPTKKAHRLVPAGLDR